MRTESATAKRGDMYGNGLFGRKRTARRGGRRTVLHRKIGLPVAIQQASCTAQENWIAGRQFSRQAVVIREKMVASERFSECSF